MKKARLIALILLIAVLTAASLGGRDFYQVSDQHVYILRHQIEISNTGRIEAEKIKAKLLVDAEGESVYQDTERYTINPPLQRTVRDGRGNLFGELTVARLRPGERCYIVTERRISHRAVAFQDSIYRLGEDYGSFLAKEENAQYLRAEEKIESEAPAIREKAAEFSVVFSPAERARAIYEFVNLYLIYDENPKFANRGALSAILSGRGVCDEYAALFVALCRACRIPARLVGGYWVTDPFDPGNWVDLSRASHAWAEFYLPGAGWIPVEPAYIYTLNGERQPKEDYFAGLPGDDRHFITSYPEAKEISVSYSYAAVSGSVVRPDLRIKTTEILVRQLP